MKIQLPFATRLALAGVSAILIKNSPGYAGNDNSGNNAAPAQPQNVGQNAPPQTQIVAQNLVFTHRSFYAAYESFDPSGCLVTDVLVQGTFEVNRITVNGQIVSVELNPSTSVLVSIFNVCTLESPMFASGSTGEIGEMAISPDLSWARLRVRIPAFNFSTNGALYFDIDLILTAIESSQTSRDHAHISEDGVLLTLAEADRVRMAAAQGAVVFVEIGTNMTSDPSGFFDAEIYNQQTHEAIVTPP